MTLIRPDVDPASIQAPPGTEHAELPAEQVVEGISHKRDEDEEDEEDRFHS
jgi:hypothetical protein